MAKAVFAQWYEASPQFWGEVPAFCSLSIPSSAVKLKNSGGGLFFSKEVFYYIIHFLINSVSK